MEKEQTIDNSEKFFGCLHLKSSSWRSRGVESTAVGVAMAAALFHPRSYTIKVDLASKQQCNITLINRVKFW